MVCYP